MGTVKPSQYVKQLLGSVKSMYEMRMPPEFVSVHATVLCTIGHSEYQILLSSISPAGCILINKNLRLWYHMYCNKLINSVFPLLMQCLSYLEDRLLELNERSQLLTNSLQDNPLDADLAEIVPRAVSALK